MANWESGEYRTPAGSSVFVAAKPSKVSFDWFEEGACIDCQVTWPPDAPGRLVWRCEHCGGGSTRLERVAPLGAADGLDRTDYDPFDRVIAFLRAQQAPAGLIDGLLEWAGTPIVDRDKLHRWMNDPSVRQAWQRKLEALGPGQGAVDAKESGPGPGPGQEAGPEENGTKGK